MSKTAFQVILPAKSKILDYLAFDCDSAGITLLVISQVPYCQAAVCYLRINSFKSEKQFQPKNMRNNLFA